MNCSRIVGVSLLLYCWSPLQEKAYCQSRDEILGRNVEMLLQNSSTSDQLNALAKAADVNCVADATYFAAHPKNLTLTERDALLNWVLKIANEQKLSWRREGNRTLLFWSEPDVAVLANALLSDAVLNNEQLNPAFIVQLNTPKPNTATQQPQAQQGAQAKTAHQLAYEEMQKTRTSVARVTALLADYLEANHGWDRKAIDLSVNFKLSQLPSELASEIKAIVVAKIVVPAIDKPKQWFSSETWRTVRVGIKRSAAPGEPALLLLIGNQNGRTFRQALYLQPPASRMARVAVPRLKRVALAQITPRDDDEPNTAPATGVVGGQAAPIQIANWRRDEQLKIQVSLEAKEQPLSEMLAALQKQSKVKLQLAADQQLNQKRVTVSAKSMPLGEMMDSLARLYGADWDKKADGFEMRGDKLTASQQELLRVGDLRWFRYWQQPMRYKVAPERLTLDEVPNWEDEFLNAGQGEALNSPQGVAFSDLPAALQGKLRNEVQAKAGLELLRSYSKGLLVTQDPVLQTGPPTFRTAEVRKTARGEVQADKTPNVLQVAVMGDSTLPLYAFLLNDQTIQREKQKQLRQQAQRNGADTTER